MTTQKMKKYAVLIERTMFTEVVIEAADDEEADRKAWDAAIAYEKANPITDELGEIAVRSVEVME